MGIQVVVTGDRRHYDNAQKVPLTLDRENVQRGFLRQVRVAVFSRIARPACAGGCEQRMGRDRNRLPRLCAGGGAELSKASQNVSQPDVTSREAPENRQLIKPPT